MPCALPGLHTHTHYSYANLHVSCALLYTFSPLLSPLTSTSSHVIMYFFLDVIPEFMF